MMSEITTEAGRRQHPDWCAVFKVYPHECDCGLHAAIELEAILGAVNGDSLAQAISLYVQLPRTFASYRDLANAIVAEYARLVRHE